MQEEKEEEEEEEEKEEATTPRAPDVSTPPSPPALPLHKMWQLWILPLVIFFSPAANLASRVPEGHIGNSVKTSIFLSPPFFLSPGSVANKFYFNIPFPKGHIAIKSFNAETVDENGVSIPLHETYLHHWVVQRYYGEKKNEAEHDFSKIILAGNSGVCKGTLGQQFGLGSETRRTSTWVPDPYGIEVGDPQLVPDGYEERWMMNVHAIDTREVQDKSGCIECKCSLYNVTVDEYGDSFAQDYIGGLRCCYDHTQCKLREGFNGGGMKKLYLKYTVKWVEWDETILPVKIYIFDVTDSGTMSHASIGSRPRPSCKVEYQVNRSDKEGNDDEFVYTKKAKIVIPHGGEIVFGVAHQHGGGIGSALYGKGGRTLCTSLPTYGTGDEAGNEAGYIVGMSTCYPEPGSVMIADGELLTLVSNYSNKVTHTGVMGLFYILVAEPQPQSTSNMLSQIMPWTLEMRSYWWAFALVGGIAVISSISFCRRNEEGYEAL